MLAESTPRNGLSALVGFLHNEGAVDSRRKNPAKKNTARRLRLNQLVKQSVQWMPMYLWNQNTHLVDLSSMEARACYGRLDLASAADITVFVLVFPLRPVMTRVSMWLRRGVGYPQDNLPLRVARDHVPDDTWHAQGHLQTTEGNVVHYAYIEHHSQQLSERLNICEIAYDRWGGVQMSHNLEDAGFTVVVFGQGFRDMSPPSKKLMKLGLEGKLAHGAPSPVMDGR